MSADEELAARVGGEIARLLLEALPRMGRALDTGRNGVGFTANVQFRKRRDDILYCTLKAGPQIPPLAIDIKVDLIGDQLSLFVAPPVTKEEDDAGDE